MFLSDKRRKTNPKRLIVGYVDSPTGLRPQLDCGHVGPAECWEYDEEDYECSEVIGALAQTTHLRCKECESIASLKTWVLIVQRDFKK